jgi:hypothetical protein
MNSRCHCTFRGEKKVAFPKGTSCLALYCYDYLENIGFVYPTVTMIVTGPSFLY